MHDSPSTSASSVFDSVTSLDSSAIVHSAHAALLAEIGGAGCVRYS